MFSPCTVHTAGLQVPGQLSVKCDGLNGMFNVTRVCCNDPRTQGVTTLKSTGTRHTYDNSQLPASQTVGRGHNVQDTCEACTTPYAVMHLMVHEQLDDIDAGWMGAQ